MKTIDIKFNDLCDEIDYWKNESAYWKREFEEERKARTELLNENIKSAKRGVANALMFTLSIEDKKDGSLSISKENRKQLAENWKQ